jgi:hypothetical protein
MRKITTEITIEAEPEKVWEVIMNFHSYSEWNPFIQAIVGEKKAGSRLEVTLIQENGKPIVFKPICQACIPNKEFRWTGHLIIPGIFDGEHMFRLEKAGNNTTRFVQSEKFKGVLIPFAGKVLKSTTLSFEKMNVALKERVEAGIK